MSTYTIKTVIDGHIVIYSVEVDPAQVRAMAIKAFGSKGRQSRDGAVLVKIVSAEKAK